MNIPIPVDVTLTNIGDLAAHNTVVKASFSHDGSQKLVGLTSSAGSCSLESEACTLGTVNPGDHISFTATIIPLYTNGADVSLTATESEKDLDPSDNNNGSEVVAQDYTLSLSKQSLSLVSGGHGDVTLTIIGYYITGFNLPITFSCAGLPPGASCSFSPASVTPGNKSVYVDMTISAPQTASLLQKRLGGARALLALWLVPLGVIVSFPERRRIAGAITAALVLFVLVGLQACGGGSSSHSSGGGGGGGAQQQNYNVVVTANGSGDNHTATLKLSID